MSEAFPNLFRPIRIGGYELKNRIMNTGHAAHHQLGDGTPSDTSLRWRRLAWGIPKIADL